VDGNCVKGDQSLCATKNTRFVLSILMRMEKKSITLVRRCLYEFTDSEGMKQKSRLRIVCCDLHWFCKALYWFWLRHGGKGKQREQSETLYMALECKSNSNFVD
jgi:hypothetical protein